MHLCNHILRQSGGGTWDTSLYTVRGVGSGSRDVNAWCANGLYAEDRGLCLVPMVLEHWQHCGDSILRGIQKGMFEPIRLDHTNCLQVAIKTQSSECVI